MENAVYKDRLNALRGELDKMGVDGFIVPRADEYQGEYVPASSDRLRFLTGFTGSAGYAVALKNFAGVFSDGRYTIQLKQQIDPALFETGDSTKTTIADWVAEKMPDGAVIGYDPRLHTPQEIKRLAEKGLSLRALEQNPLDAIWADRPDAPASTVESFPAKSAGQSVAEKLDAAASALGKQGADAAIITLPDSIAWLLNVRANDIPHIPVALSNAILKSDGTLGWFIDEKRVPDSVRETFGNRAVILPPETLEREIAKFKGAKLLVDGRRTSAWFFDLLKAEGIEVIDAKDPVIALKAHKNEAEKASMRTAHIRDGAAVTKFLKFLSEEGAGGTLTELDVEAKLESFRREAPEYRDSSFDTIAGYGPNGAIVHYRATRETNARIMPGSLLLVDSGAQYADGTTDITRTVAIGTPTKEMKERFTLVLKGHIALASARFPAGTTGAQLDALARAPLWREGLDFAHGTGHGVGCYLSVHEEAASISPRGHDALEPGMIISNEPGYYEEGAYGIRTENLILVQEDGVCAATGKQMLSFETLTFAPYDPVLILQEMLDPAELGWLSAYNRKTAELLAPLLDNATKQWLLNSIR